MRGSAATGSMSNTSLHFLMKAARASMCLAWMMTILLLISLGCFTLLCSLQSSDKCVKASSRPVMKTQRWYGSISVKFALTKFCHICTYILKEHKSDHKLQCSRLQCHTSQNDHSFLIRFFSSKGPEKVELQSKEYCRNLPPSLMFLVVWDALDMCPKYSSASSPDPAAAPCLWRAPNRVYTHHKTTEHWVWVQT